MKLLQDIIDQAVDEKVPVGTLLRRCLVLEQKIKNEKFRQWLNWELDGYFNGEEVPSYREFHCVNMGLFIGLGVQLNDQPIPMHILSEPEREAMETVKLRQPAASYNTDDKNAQILWSQSLVTKYQHKFLKGAT